ncbi:vitellogenin-like, partial [Diaphorina citri]|uniref:Vitellogenin-like n=1 Tax=Diaphorina citri TaxID=121845 RepID=A0A1S4ERM3_DIACI
MLSPKTYGLQYSKNYLSSYAMKEENLGYIKNFQTIGSEDSILPKGISASLRRVLGGLEMEKDRFAVMTASVSDLLGLLENQFSTEESRRQEKNAKQSSNNDSHSTEKIAQMLNIKREQAEQVEAQIYATIFGGNRLFAFDNHTVEQIPRTLKAVAAQLQNGQNFNYTKLYNSFVINVGFPTAMGLPFQFSYKKTNLVSVGGEMKLKTHPSLVEGNDRQVAVPNTANVTVEAQLLYAGKGQSKISFITPNNQQRYIAGNNKYFQVNIPIKAAADLDLQNNQVAFKVEPLNKNKEEKIFIATQHPYTTIQNILNLTPAEKSQNTKDISVRKTRE